MSDGVKKLVGGVLLVASFFIPGGPMVASMVRLAGVSLLSAGFAPKVERPKFRNELRTGPVRSMESPEPIFYGTVRTSGTFAFPPRTSGFAGEYLWYCIVFGRKGQADVAVTSYEKLHIDGTEIDVATEIDVDGYVTHSRFLDADGNPLVRVKFYYGTDGQTADPWLTSAFPFFWTANHRLRGCAYMVMRFELDTSAGGTNPDNNTPNVWESGVPRDVSVLLRGRPIYSAALDSTNGGTGAHRVNDPSTWEFSDNAIDCARDYLTDARLGPGVAHARVDDSVTIPESGVCDEAVTVWDGFGESTTQARWTCDGIVYADEAHGTALLNLLSACVGELSRSGGHYRLFAGHYETPSHTIDESWLAGSWRLRSGGGRSSRYNAVRGQFADPGRNYQTTDYPTLTNATWETADGGRQFLDLRLPFTTDSQRAQRAAKVWHKRSRHLREFELVCNLRALAVEPMDTATINLPEMGLSGVVARCTNWRPDESGVIVLSFRVEESADWTINYATDLTEPPAFVAMGTAADGVPTASSLTASGVPGGIALGWVSPDMTRISHVEVWGSQTNDRATATRLTRTRGEDFVHNVTGGETWYYWIVTRSDARWGPWHPVSATAGVSATALRPIPVDGYATVDGPASWSRAQDGTTWAPTATTTDIDWTFAIAGTAVARISRRVTRDSAGLLTVSTTTHPAGDLNTARVTINTIGGGTRAVTLVATYNHDGYVKAIAQGIVASLSGTDGDDGIPREGFLLNGGFETNTTQHWTVGAGGTGLTTVGTPVFSGTYAGRVGLAVNASSTAAQQIVLSPPAGTMLRFIAHVQRNESAIPNRDLRLQARFGDSPAGGGFVDEATIATASASTSGWQLLTGTVIIPSGAQSVAFRFAKAAPHNTDETGQWFIDDCWLYQEGEDGAPGLTFSISNPSQTIATDAGGTPLAGAFDSAVGQFTVFSGGTDVTADCTFSAVQSNVTGSINTATNTPVTGAKGSYRITALGAETGYLEMTAVYNGQTVKARFSVSKARRGSAATFAQDTSFSNVTQTSYPSTGQGGPIQIAVQGGTVKVAASGAYRGTTNAAGQTTTLTGKIQYREVGSGTWIDFPGAVATGTQAYYDENDLIWYPGVLSITEQTMSGPVDPEVWEFQLVMYRSAGNATTTTFPSGGSLTAEWVSS